MPAKKNSSVMAGGALLFLGSLIYLYVVFAWYSSGATVGTWLSAAQFLAPFVVAAAVISSISLFFMGIGTAAGQMTKEMHTNILWKFVMLGALTTIILTAGGSWFYAVIVGFVLTYLGATLAAM